MRLFVAIPVSGEVAEALSRLLDRWRSRSWPVKWARPEALHLTLKFLGQVSPERHSSLVDAVGDAVRGTPALAFSLAELGAFPGMSRARVLWAGLESEAALELLVHRIERAAAGLGFPLEGKPYRPHVTLGRVREGSHLPAEAIRALEEERLPAAGFLSGEVLLYRSLTGPGGAHYDVQATFPLAQPV